MLKYTLLILLLFYSSKFSHLSYRLFIFTKLVLLIIALGLASFLAFGENKDSIAPDHKVIFVLDINRSMNTKDALLWTIPISRLQAAKLLIQKTILSDPQFPYGLILFNASADYIIPPTLDTWTFLLYLTWITTNLLPDWSKDFAQLSWLLHDKYASYIILSDFDVKAQQGTVSLVKWTSLVGIWTLAGDTVRYANGIRYYDNGKSVFSSRNDQFAQSLGLSYTSLTNVDWFSIQKLLYHGINLPVSQRIFLYSLLWILVILVVLL